MYICPHIYICISDIYMGIYTEVATLEGTVDQRIKSPWKLLRTLGALNSYFD